MIAVPILEGETPEQTNARLEVLLEELNEGVDKILEGHDPIDQMIVRAIAMAGSAQNIPSFDAKLKMVTEAFHQMLHAVQELRPEKGETWTKLNEQMIALSRSITAREIQKYKERTNGNPAVH